jgi:hypothetical protein
VCVCVSVCVCVWMFVWVCEERENINKENEIECACVILISGGERKTQILKMRQVGTLKIETERYTERRNIYTEG